MEIIQPAHNKLAIEVKNWQEIEQEAFELRDFIRNGKFKGQYERAYAISHAQVSNEPKKFFVINENLENINLKKIFGHWCIINPEILEQNNLLENKEACMSWPFRDPKWTKRFNVIKVKYQVPSLFGLLRPVRKRLKELPAFIIQHELDHAIGKNIYGK